MAWTTPADRATSYVVTAADWNIIEDDLVFLYGDVAWTLAAGVTFANSWADFASTSPFGFRKIGTRIELRGAIKSGTVGAVTALTMPGGYRPTQTLNISIASNNAFGAIVLASTGVLQVVVGSNVWASLDNITYDTI